MAKLWSMSEKYRFIFLALGWKTNSELGSAAKIFQLFTEWYKSLELGKRLDTV